ncbi:MAG: InlB B-repeat-containing protein [Spirochaetales bacterium]|nr:InlB B-repeat-containing protein [Spirochaetales bacterium]
MKKAVFLTSTWLFIILLTGCEGPSSTIPDDSTGSEVTYSITYNGNGADGGSEPVDGNTYASGESVEVSGPGSIYKDGYNFIYWNTIANGSGDTYYPHEELTFGTADVTLYAQWEIDLEPPSVYSFYPGRGDTGIYLDQDIHIASWNSFDLVSAEAAFSISPAVNGTKYLRWFTADAGAGSELTIELDDLDPSTQYTVIFSTDLEMGGQPLDEEWSWTFTTGTEKEFPEPITLGRPEFLMSNHFPPSLTYEVTWSVVTGATEYELQVGRGEAFAGGYDDSFTITGGTTKQITAERTNEYYVRVRAHDGSGNYSEWSRIYFIYPFDTDIAEPTQLIYAGGYVPSLYEYNGTAGGNDEPVSGFDHEMNSAFFYSGSFFYMSAENGICSVYQMVDGYGNDEEVTGFDYLDWDSSIYNVAGVWYYSTHEDDPGLGLYKMVSGVDNDEEVQGMDHVLGQNSNGPYFYHDGANWFYTVNSYTGGESGVYQIVGTESNGTGSNDIEVTGIEDGGSLILAPSTMGSGFYYSGGAQWYEYDPSGDDIMLTGFDREPGNRQILTDGTEIYYIHDNALLKKVDGISDDTQLSDLNSGNGEVESVFTYDGVIYYLVNHGVYQLDSGVDIAKTGFDNLSNNNCTQFDGTDFYYLQFDSSAGKRVIYKKAGTEANDSGNDDILMEGMDYTLYDPGYAFALVGGEIHYASGSNIYKLDSGAEDPVIAQIDTDRIYYFVYYNGHYYYSDEQENIYRYNEDGPDPLIFDGAKADTDMTSFILLP